MKKHLLILVFGITSLLLKAQAQIGLQPGDIFFTGFQLGVTPSSPDRFAFVVLKNIEPGTKILFTDKALLAGTPQTLCTNEDTCLWTSPNAVVNAGTVVTITEVVDATNGTANVGTCEGNMGSLSSSGDQIIALQRGQDGSLTFLAAISNSGFLANCATQCNNNNATCLPAPLIDTPYFMSFSISPVIINGYYNGPTTFDSVTSFYTAIRNQTNWVVSRQADPAASWPSPWSFSVGTVSIGKKVAQSSLLVFPNPSSGSVNIKTKSPINGKIRLMNIIGVMLEERQIATETIQFNNLKPGLYLVQLLDGKNHPTQAVKLIVK